MDYCKLGKPIDSERVQKYEMLYHRLINKHFPGKVFPRPFDYDDILNGCRMEAVRGFQKLDPAKAMDCYIEDPAKRAAKLAEKQANPEDTFAQAEMNLIYWQVDNHLKRIKWNYGVRTSSKIRRGKTISLESFLLSVAEETSEIETKATAADEQTAAALYKALDWFRKYRSDTKAKSFFNKMTKNHQELVLEHIYKAIDKRRDHPEIIVVPITSDEQDEMRFSQFGG